MKQLITILVAALLLSLSTHAQFTKAELQATGLTCAMCSNAINKAVGALPFIEKIDSDIKNSAFSIRFKKEKAVNIDEIQKAVEDAGFSVGNLRLTGNFDNLRVENDGHALYNGIAIHFLQVKPQVLDGEATITLMDKNFVTESQFKKYTRATKKSCLQSGKADNSHTTIETGTRVFHATL